MKKLLLFSVIVLLSMRMFSQQNIFTVGGGYSWANIESTEANATGYRINALYEYNPLEASIAHGAAFSYLTISATDGDLKSTISSLPIYYAPKIMLGNSDKFKVFLNGALGMQFSWLKREGIISLSDNDMGFYLGAGGGIMLYLKENVFLNAGYDFAWISNSWYADGLLHSATGGIGFRF
jgi:hypothetical protein